MRKEPPLIVAIVEAFARQAGIDSQMLWRALDGLPSDPKLVDGLVSAFHPMVRRSDFVLSSDPKNATIDTMSATEFATAHRGRPIENAKHPLMAALKKAGVTLTEEAASVKRSPASVRSFCFPEKHRDYRPIPKLLAKHWEKTRGVPMSTWPRFAD